MTNWQKKLDFVQFSLVQGAGNGWHSRICGAWGWFVTIIITMIFHSIFHKNIVLSLIILLNIVCFFTRLLFTKYGIILIFLNNCFHFVSFFLKQIEKKHILLQTWSMLHFCKSMWSYCLLIFAKTFFTIASELLSWSCILKLSNVYRLSCLSNDGNLTKVKL